MATDTAPEEIAQIKDIITPEVLTKIVHGYNPALKLVSWNAQLGCKLGDNYNSTMYAVKLDLESKTCYGKKTVHVMMKNIPRNAFRTELSNEMNTFKKEAQFYQEIVPLLKEFQRQKKISTKEVCTPWPKCYAAHIDGSTDYLALEDLKCAGYSTANRSKCLDFTHCSIVLKNLAKYHAISAAKYGGSRSKILQDFPLLDTGMFSRKDLKVNEFQQNFFSQAYKNLATSLKEAGEIVAASRLEKLEKVQLRHILGDLTDNNVKFAVISHGDFCLYNMMFKYGNKDTDKKCPVDVKFVDFQMPVATSRLIDVYYFLLTSVQLEVLVEREQNLLRIYLEEFSRFGEMLGLNFEEKGLTWEIFLEEADRYRLFGLCFGLILAPMMATDTADVPDMDNLTEEEFRNSDKSMKGFYKKAGSDQVLEKVKYLVLEQLPRCTVGQQFL